MHKFLRRRDVEEATGLPTSTLYDMIAKGSFPRPINITPGRVGWLEADVAKWQEARLAEARAKASA